MSAYHVRLVEGGKIVIPAILRRKYGFAIGDTLVVEDRAGGVTIRTLGDAVAAAQAIMLRLAPADRLLSEELIAERRAEAARD